MTPEAGLDKPLSELERLSGVILDPKKAFADIAARPRWWPPIVLAIVVSVVFLACFSSRVGWESFFRQQFDKSSRVQQLSPEQREQAIQMQVKFGSYMGYGGAVVGTFIYALVIAGALTLVFRVMMNGQVTFKQLFAVTSYTFVLGVISGGLAILVMYLKPPEDFNLQNPLAFNVGAYLPSETPKWLMTLGTSLDLFTIWTIMLLATGVAAADRKIAWGKALTWVAVLWLVWVGLKTAGSVLVPSLLVVSLA